MNQDLRQRPRHDLFRRRGLLTTRQTCSGLLALAPFSLVLLGTFAFSANAHAHDMVRRAFTAYGAPVSHVAGAALVKLVAPANKASSIAQYALERGERLKEIEGRTGVRLTWVSNSVLGWSLYSISDVDDAVLRPRYLPSEEETLRLLDRVRQDVAIEAAAINGWRRALAVPNDAFIGDMWHLDAIDAQGAWNITTGSSTQRVGVVDTGVIRGHQDLINKDANGYDFIADTFSANDGDGRDAEYNDPGDGGDCGQGTQPDSWHGTHVSGTMIASANNSVGVAGLNWEASLVTGRGLGVCGGTDDDIMVGVAWLAGYDWQQAPNNPLSIPVLAPEDVVSVVNLSLGGGNTCTPFQQSVIDYANSQGTLIVAASGNEDGPVSSPAVCNDVIAVGAHGPDNNRSGFSNFGPPTAVYAPGGSGNDNQDWVLSTYGPGTSDYTFLPGTSMASPHVAGAVSLMLDLNPTLTRDDVVALFEQGQTCDGCDGVPTLELYDTLAEVTPGEDPPPLIDDDLEDNDTIGSAAPLNCGATLDLQANDDDYFEINLPAGATFDALLTPTGNGDIDLWLLDGAGNELKARSQNVDAAPELQSFTSAGASVFLFAFPWLDPEGDNNFGPYTLNVTCTDPPPPEPSPEPEVVVEPEPEPEAEPTPITPPGVVETDNDKLATPLLVACGDELRLFVEDEDWFVVPVDDFSTLTVTTVGEDATVPIEIQTRGGHVVIASSEDSSVAEAGSSVLSSDMTEVASRGALGAGEYAIVVRARSAPTAYTLNVSCTVDAEQEAAGCRHLRVEASLPFGFFALLVLPLLCRRRRESP